MRCYNRIILFGHLAANPELRTTKSGKAVANFSLATNRFSYGADDEKSEITDFHRIVAWQKLGEICAKHLAKGSAICVEGKLVNTSYKDDAGLKHYQSEVIAENVNIFTWKNRDKDGKEIQMAEVA